jgi:enamine deaminase RidA (YjgF/YER057c/UK114 family)
MDDTVTMNPQSPEERLAAEGFVLPAPPQPRGAYAPSCRISIDGLRLVSVSGQTCRVEGRAIAGLCDAATDLEAPRQAARVAMVNALAALGTACDGDLSRVQQVIRLRGFIRSTADFTRHPAVLDAASDLLRLAFPDQALPARTAVGASSLPDGAWIEIELEALVRVP